MKTQLLVLTLWSFVLNFVQPQNPRLPEGRTSSFLAKHPQLSTLPLGPHAVGFQVFNQFDYGRHFQPKLDFEGKPNTGQSALPIQISMWYPAQANKLKKMLFAEYRYLDAQKNSFKPLSDQEKKDAGNGLKFSAKFGQNLDLSEQQIQNILQSTTAAVLNAPKQKGPFPVIIVGVDGGPGTNNVLCEYLASLGYVVLLTPSVAHTGTWQAKQPQLALAERIGNLEYLLAFLRSQTMVDPQRIGVLGSNFDGMSALLFQMKNMQADAVASLDGWEGKTGTQESLLQSPFFDANKMRVPYLTFLQDEKNPPPYLQLSQKVLDTLRYADRYYAVLRGMDHSCLIGNLGVIPDLPAEKQQSYQFLYTRIGQFFDAYVKKSPEALQSLQKKASEMAYPTDMLKVELQQKALPPVPTPEEFEAIVMSGNLEKATQAFVAGKQLNPSLQIFDFQTLNLFAFRFGQQQKKEQVLAIWKLGTVAFPNSTSVLERLGDAYLAMGEKLQAREQFEKALRVLNQDPQLDADTKKRLQSSFNEKLGNLN
ncbi:MAG: hypothetical protein SFV55_19745 [Haliscomenobacter sp.]|uniref:dienelactone hydrolase family protein n=1 Tax=Haliscomenobacter sp. TaxID=2717303 RepID=UPI0029B8CB1E|nr:hypothetical protein [Haliscomenobacter sp.]MDX2070671.1 hypothetical protein [Haliscomenobacter sp.]